MQSSNFYNNTNSSHSHSNYRDVAIETSTSNSNSRLILNKRRIKSIVNLAAKKLIQKNQKTQVAVSTDIKERQLQTVATVSLADVEADHDLVTTSFQEAIREIFNHQNQDFDSLNDVETRFESEIQSALTEYKNNPKAIESFLKSIGTSLQNRGMSHDEVIDLINNYMIDIQASQSISLVTETSPLLSTHTEIDILKSTAHDKLVDLIHKIQTDEIKLQVVNDNQAKEVLVALLLSLQATLHTVALSLFSYNALNNSLIKICSYINTLDLDNPGTIEKQILVVSLKVMMATMAFGLYALPSQAQYDRFVIAGFKAYGFWDALSKSMPENEHLQKFCQTMNKLYIKFDQYFTNKYLGIFVVACLLVMVWGSFDQLIEGITKLVDNSVSQSWVVPAMSLLMTVLTIVPEKIIYFSGTMLPAMKKNGVLRHLAYTGPYALANTSLQFSDVLKEFLHQINNLSGIDYVKGLSAVPTLIGTTINYFYLNNQKADANVRIKNPLAAKLNSRDYAQCLFIIASSIIIALTVGESLKGFLTKSGFKEPYNELGILLGLIMGVHILARGLTLSLPKSIRSKPAVSYSEASTYKRRTEEIVENLVATDKNIKHLAQEVFKDFLKENKELPSLKKADRDKILHFIMQLYWMADKDMRFDERATTVPHLDERATIVPRGDLMASELDKLLATLGFKIIHTKGDGNCLLHAFLAQLPKNKMILEKADSDKSAIAMGESDIENAKKLLMKQNKEAKDTDDKDMQLLASFIDSNSKKDKEVSNTEHAQEKQKGALQTSTRMKALCAKYLPAVYLQDGVDQIQILARHYRKNVVVFNKTSSEHNLAFILNDTSESSDMDGATSTSASSSYKDINIVATNALSGDAASFKKFLDEHQLNPDNTVYLHYICNQSGGSYATAHYEAISYNPDVVSG